MTFNRSFRVFGFVLTICGFLSQMVLPAAAASTNEQKMRGQKTEKHIGDPPVSFEENRGQFDPRVRFAAKTKGQTVFVTADEAAFVWPVHAAARGGADESPERSSAEKRNVYALKMKFAGASSKSEMTAEGGLEGKLNYFRGNDDAKWATDVTRYARVVNKNVYNGIDVAWYGRDDGRVEYDLIAGPNADTSQIRLEFDGADAISVDNTGDLVIETPAGAIRHGKPIVYQETNGTKEPVEGAYEIDGGRVGFSLGDYDRSKALVIDPIPGAPVTYSTYLGGSGQDWPKSIKVDSADNAYIAGYTSSVNFPITSGTHYAAYDIFVTKFNSAASALIYSVIIGGSGNERAYSMALDNGGNVFLTGFTMSSDFPVSLFANDKTFNGERDAYVTKIGPTGSSIVYSTYLGGSGIEDAFSIAADGDGSAYITGVTESTNYPTTTGALDRTRTGAKDAFVTKLSPGGISLAYSTYLGGAGSSEIANAIAVDGLGRAYVTGEADANYFPVTPGSFSTVHLTAEHPDCFVTKLNSAGSALVYSAMIGGDVNDEGKAIAIDSSGNAYIAGQTSSENYPVTFGAYSSFQGQPGDGFITRVNSGGTGLSYSTYLGIEDGVANLSGIVLDSENSVYITGSTASETFPVTYNAYDQTINGALDAFIFKIDPVSFSTPGASTYIEGSANDVAEGIAVNSYGDAFITGYTESPNFPTIFGVFDRTYSGTKDGFILRYDSYWLP